jgi:thiol-disulfide isomerase/thioredoxin
VTPKTATRSRATRGKPSRNLFWWVVIGIVLLVGIVTVAVIATQESDDAGAGDEIATDVTIQGTALAPLPSSGEDPAVGEPAPVIRGVDFEGRSVSTGGPGPKVLTFLAHWCPHCQSEVPVIVSLEQSGDTDGVDVYAVATGTNPSAPNYPPSEWLERERWPFPVILDTDQAEAAASFGLTGYPFFVFVDADGNVAARTSGEVSQADLAEMFAALAAGEPVPVPGRGGSSPG